MIRVSEGRLGGVRGGSRGWLGGVRGGSRVGGGGRACGCA